MLRHLDTEVQRRFRASGRRPEGNLQQKSRRSVFAQSCPLVEALLSVREALEVDNIV